MTKEAEIPGLTFNVQNHSLGPCAGDEFKALGVVTLTASIHDLDIWDKVVTKLDGLAVYSVTTLTGQLVDVANRRASRAEEAAAKAMEDARALNEELRSSLSFKDAELENLRGQLAMALRELEVSRDFERTVDAMMATQPLV
jgi:hypothetical protein